MLAIGGVTVIAEPAKAAEEPVAVAVERNDRAELRAIDTVAGELHRAMARVRTDYLDRSARHGVPMDSRRIATLTDPTGSVIAATSDTVAVDGIDVGRYDVPGREGRYAQAIKIRSHEVAASSARDTSGPAIGFAGGPENTGYQLHRNGSVVVSSADKPKLVINGTAQYLRSDWWKYVLPEDKEEDPFDREYRKNSDFWMYARRGTADAQGAGNSLTDMTIRSRPWGGSTAFRNMIKSSPTGTTLNCSAGARIEVKQGNFGVKLPMSNCGALSGLSNVSSELEFGADWSGKSSTQQTVEAIGSVRTVEAAEPSWADYIWATYLHNISAPRYENLKWTDTGW